MQQRVRPLGTWSVTWRILVALIGIALLVNGSVRESDDVWPLGPMSQYAFSPGDEDTILITRVEGLLADGRRIDLPLRVETAGIGRAEVEARIPEIKADPSLLRPVAQGWVDRHPDEPRLRQVWLVQDETHLYQGRKQSTDLVELATWKVTR